MQAKLLTAKKKDKEALQILNKVDTTEIKIPLKIVRDKEVYDGDEIDIEFLDSSKGTFKLYMNEYDRPRYNPFVSN